MAGASLDEARLEAVPWTTVATEGSVILMAGVMALITGRRLLYLR